MEVEVNLTRAKRRCAVQVVLLGGERLIAARSPARQSRPSTRSSKVVRNRREKQSISLRDSADSAELSGLRVRLQLNFARQPCCTSCPPGVDATTCQVFWGPLAQGEKMLRTKALALCAAVAAALTVST